MMPYTIRNARPSVLFIPDADLRLEAGQTAVVTVLTPQMQSLLAFRALDVITHERPSPVPVITPSVAEEQPVPAIEEQSSRDETLDTGAPASPLTEEKRRGRKAAARTLTMEENDDAQ